VGSLEADRYFHQTDEWQIESSQVALHLLNAPGRRWQIKVRAKALRFTAIAQRRQHLFIHHPFMGSVLIDYP
jgi:hypothetical protein